MTPCVCGHPEDDHTAKEMAIRPNRPASPYIVQPGMGSVAHTHAAAPYDRQECWCGCGEYLPDTEATHAAAS